VVSHFQKLVNYGVDYVTSTYNESDGQRRIQCVGNQWLADEVGRGNECREWEGWGYRGLIAGCVQIGTRSDSTLLRVTGPLAGEKIPIISRWATNVSRIDFQTTVALVRPSFRLAEHVERQAMVHKRKHHGLTSVRLLRDSNSGNTVYLGRRVSDRFIRIYDKGAESKLPELAGCWRAEVQYNNSFALQATRELRAFDFESSWLVGRVVGELSRLGISWIEMPKGSLSVLNGPRTKYSTDNERLDWLSNQVRPSVQKLIDRGKREEVLKALGLTVES